MRKNWSRYISRKTFEIQSLRPRMCKNFVITKTIYSNSERYIRTIFETEFFLTYSWKFLRSNTSEQLELKLEKIIGVQKHAGKDRKKSFIFYQSTATINSNSCWTIPTRIMEEFCAVIWFLKREFWWEISSI